jgi:hypothetical protein
VVAIFRPVSGKLEVPAKKWPFAAHRFPKAVSGDLRLWIMLLGFQPWTNPAVN